MNRFLLRQSLFFSLGPLLVAVAWAVGVPHYSSVSQHVSELQLLDHPIATYMRIAPILVGASILLFGIGAWRVAPTRFAFTALTSLAAAANFISAGVFECGDPRHGLYGVGMLMPLVPACFAAESGLDRTVVRICLGFAVAGAAYLWLNLSGLDPMRGITQRAGIVVILGWYAYASHQLLLAVGAGASGNDRNEAATNPAS